MAKKERDPIDLTAQERGIFRETFAKYPEVLAWIGNRCGAWAQDPQAVKPELIAFWNTLLGAAGIVHTHNLRTLAEKLLEASNDSDLIEYKKAAKQTAKEE